MYEYARLRAYLLHVCRGYWNGTTCASKRRAQRDLVELRRARALGLAV